MNADGIRHRIERVLTEPGQELGRWARFAQLQVRIWRFCARRLRENNRYSRGSSND